MPKKSPARRHCPYCGELYAVRSGGITRHVIRCPQRPEEEGGAYGNGNGAVVARNLEEQIIVAYTPEGDLRVTFTLPRAVIVESILRSMRVEA